MVLPFEWLGGEPREMKFGIRFQVVIAGALLMIMLTAAALSQEPSDRLASPESFAAVADTAERSAALFGELGKVLTHPRCVNCHPAGDHPRQGDQARLHQPPVERGADGHGLPAMRCSICHQQANFDTIKKKNQTPPHTPPPPPPRAGKPPPDIPAPTQAPARHGGRSLG